MRPVQHLAFAEKQLAPSRGESTEASGGLVKRIVLTVAGTVTHSAGSSSVDRAGAIATLGDLKLTQDGSVIGSALAKDLFQAYEIFLGGASDQVDSDANGTVPIAGTLDLDFGRVMKGAAIDASGQHRVGYRVETLPATGYSSLATTYALSLKASIEHDGGVAAGPYLLPRPQYKVLDASVASAQLYDEFIAPANGFLLGIQVRTLDNSEPFRNRAVDGLIKRMKVRHIATDGSGTSELVDTTWRQIRNLCRNRWRVPAIKLTGLAQVDDGLEPGVAIFPTFDPAGPSGAMRMRSNEKIQVYFDTTGTAESGYANVTPASQDQIFVTYHFFQPVNEGSADRAQRGVSQLSAVNARVARAATTGRGSRRAARRGR
jgi:hypothetical protein